MTSFEKYRYKIKFTIIFSFGLIVAALALHPKDFGIFVDNNQDTISFLRSAYQAEQLIKSGIYFPRLSAYDFSGWGYALFQFYPPLSFLMVGYISHFFTSDILSAMAVMVMLNSLIAGWLIYGLCRCLEIRSSGSLVAAFAFICYPFFVFAAYRATPTYLAVTFSVALLLSSVLFLKRPGFCRGLFVSLAICILMMTHVISSVLMFIIIFIFLLLIVPILYNPIELRIVTQRFVALGAFSGLGAGLAAFQFLPIIFYGQARLLRISALLGDFNKFVHSARFHSTLHGLLSPRLADSVHSALPADGEFGFQLGLPVVTGFFLFLAIAPGKTLSDRAYWGIAVLFVTLVLFTTPHFAPILAPVFGVIQFPFRLLSIAAIPGAVIFARAVSVAWYPQLAANEFDNPIKRAVAVLIVCSIVGWSSIASQMARPIQTDTGFNMPVNPSLIFAKPSSTYSGDYLVNAYAFPDLFPKEILLGRTQYMLYWHDFLAENGVYYDMPIFRPTGRERLKMEIALLDGITPPVYLKIRVGQSVVFDGPIETRSATIEATVPPGDIAGAISYEADKSVEKDGRYFFARIPSVVFDGLPENETVRYWNEFRYNESGRMTKRTFDIDNPDGSANVFVLPVLAYPLLQSVTLNGTPSACRPIPRNDMVFCGVQLPAGVSRVVVRFTGMGIANIISEASLALLVAIGIFAGVRSQRQKWANVRKNMGFFDD